LAIQAGAALATRRCLTNGDFDARVLTDSCGWRHHSDPAELFHVAGEFCYPDPRGERDPDGIFEYYRQIGSGTVALALWVFATDI
jgi:hypothetical protein